MLTYLINTTERLVVMAGVIGLIAAFVNTYFSSKAKIFLQVGGVIGAILSFVMMYYKNFTNQFAANLWNLREFIAAIVLFVLFVVFYLISKKWKKVGEIGASISLALMMVCVIAYYSTTILELPYTSYVGNSNNVFSTSYLLSMLGMIFGIIITLVFGISVYKGTMVLGKPGTFVVFIIGNLINLARFAGLACGVLLTRRIVVSNHTLFEISKFTSNNSNYYIYAIIALAVIVQIIVLIRSFTDNETYNNPAQRRKIVAKWRRRRKWVASTIVCAVLVVLNLTVVNAYNSQEVQLSPVEDTEVSDGKITIPYENVTDGHLHRFGYVTDSGTQVRFIVVQKPNSMTFGIGLDACDICGEAGYYERDGEVICSRCDVVMNVNTIGFKGGCNPIPFDYTVDGTQIIIETSVLAEFEDKFSK